MISSAQTFAFLPPTQATPPVPVVPPEPAGPTRVERCLTTVDFQLIRARTTGGSCWQEMKAGSQAVTVGGVNISPRAQFFQTADRFVLNGIPFPAAPAGSTYVLAAPTSAAPGGHDRDRQVVEIKLGPVVVLRGKLLWKLPSGSAEGTLAALSLPSGTLGGLSIGGADRGHLPQARRPFTTSFPISVTLPSIFKPSPGATGTITGATEISTDDTRGRQPRRRADRGRQRRDRQGRAQEPLLLVSLGGGLAHLRGV